MVGGAEKFICGLIATFLFLFILIIQLYVHVLSRYESFQARTPCERLVHNYDRYDEDVNFECHVKLLIAGWVAAMLVSAIVLVVYFVVWYLCFQLGRRESTNVHPRRQSFANLSKSHQP